MQVRYMNIGLFALNMESQALSKVDFIKTVINP